MMLIVRLTIAFALILAAPATAQHESKSWWRSLERSLGRSEEQPENPIDKWREEERVKQQSRDRFDLWNSCKPMGVSGTHNNFLGSLTSNFFSTPEIMDFVREEIYSMAERRLTAARLYESSSETSVFIRLDIFNNEILVSVNYAKPLLDEASGLTHRTTTWEKRTVVPYARGSQFERLAIKGVVSEFIDAFIDDYLRVNTDACS